MADVVWCVFQRLQGETHPSLAAVCATAQAAGALVELSQREQEQAGDAPGEWVVQRWSVLQEELEGIEEADQISQVLDPMRAAIAAPPAETGGEGQDPAPG